MSELTDKKSANYKDRLNFQNALQISVKCMYIQLLSQVKTTK